MTIICINVFILSSTLYAVWKDPYTIIFQSIILSNSHSKGNGIFLMCIVLYAFYRECTFVCICVCLRVCADQDQVEQITGMDILFLSARVFDLYLL